MVAKEAMMDTVVSMLAGAARRCYRAVYPGGDWRRYPANDRPLSGLFPWGAGKA